MSHSARITCIQCDRLVPEDICSEDFDSRQSKAVIHYLTQYADVLRDIALIKKNDPGYAIYLAVCDRIIPSDVLMFIGRHYGHDLLLDSNYEEENKRFIFDMHSLEKYQEITPSRRIYIEVPPRSES